MLYTWPTPHLHLLYTFFTRRQIFSPLIATHCSSPDHTCFTPALHLIYTCLQIVSLLMEHAAREGEALSLLQVSGYLHLVYAWFTPGSRPPGSPSVSMASRAPGLHLVYTWFTPGLHLLYTRFAIGLGERERGTDLPCDARAITTCKAGVKLV